jgi:hypothetical protein
MPRKTETATQFEWFRTGVLGEVVVYRRGRVRLEHDDIATEIVSLSRRSSPSDFPMRLIGMRESRSENSWMHNAPLLMRGERQLNDLTCALAMKQRGRDAAGDVHAADGVAECRDALRQSAAQLLGGERVPHAAARPERGAVEAADVALRSLVAVGPARFR